MIGVGDEVDVAFAQIENVTGQTNQNPSEYVSTGVGTGPELVTNGDFSNGTTGWTPFSDAVLSVVSGRLRITSPTTFDGAFQSFPTTIGKTYSLSYSVFKGTASTYRVELGFGPAQVNNYASGAITAASQIKTVSWVATHATTYITFRCDNAGTYIEADNVSVKLASHGANVDGVQYFNTLNANTVTANVVTEAVGSALTRANTQFGELHGGDRW